MYTKSSVENQDLICWRMLDAHFKRSEHKPTVSISLYGPGPAKMDLRVIFHQIAVLTSSCIE